MKEQDPGKLTTQALPSTMKVGRNFMGLGAPPRETELTPESAADRLQTAQRRNEARAAAQNILASMTSEQRDALRSQLMEQEGLTGLAQEENEIRRKERNIRLLKSKEERDKYFDHFFSLVDATPHEFFDQVFNRNLQRVYEYDGFIDLISSGAVGNFDELNISLADLGFPDQTPSEEIRKFSDGLREDLSRYQLERKLRGHLHDVNAALYLPSLKAKQLFEHMQQFGSEEADLAWRTPGVLQMARIYEEVLREDMAKNDGYLRPEAVLGDVDSVQNAQGEPVINKVQRGEVEIEARKRFMDLVDRGEVVVRNQDGEAVVLRRGDLRDSEIDKIFTFAKGMSIINLRLISIAAESKLPPGSARYTSLFLQDIISTFSPFVHLEAKFQIGGKAISPYLYKSEKAKKMLGMFTQWDPMTLKKSLDKFEKDGFEAIMNSPEFFYIQKLNPNMAGDIFTWLSWRANENDSIPSMIQRYVKRGKERMRGRLNRGLKPADLSDSDYLNEYANWIGTGLRFEKLRGELTKLDPHKSWEEQKNSLRNGDEKQRKTFRAMESADALLERMVTLQPHRLFLKSEAIRQRLGLDKSAIQRVMKNLSLAEETLLRRREDLLGAGQTFATVSLDFNVIPETERLEVEQFAARLREDFARFKDKYYEEFVLRREYRHGFVLWDGDAPKDEFNFTALGQPGVVRRARDATAQEEAWTEEIKLLDGLEHIRTIDDLVGALEAIHKKVDDYDKEKAQLSTAEKAEAFAQFFAESSFTKWPVFGQIERMFGKKVSMAKIAFGEESPAWSPIEIRQFFYKLRSKDYITDEQYKRLSNKYATIPDVVADFGVTWAQFVTLALAIYLINKLLKEK